MFRDVSLVSAARAADRPAQAGPGSERRGGSSEPGDAEARTALLRALFLVWDLLTHPLFLGLVVVLAVFRLLLGLGARRAAY